MSISAYEELVARGCICGAVDYTPCPVHVKPGDNRGIRAWFLAGMPEGFPFESVCAVCGADGLTYPNVELDDPKRSGGYRPTLICPRCSGPPSEARLVADALQFGHVLNGKRVFGQAA